MNPFVMLFWIIVVWFFIATLLMLSALLHQIINDRKERTLAEEWVANRNVAQMKAARHRNVR